MPSITSNIASSFQINVLNSTTAKVNKLIGKGEFKQACNLVKNKREALLKPLNSIEQKEINTKPSRIALALTQKISACKIEKYKTHVNGMKLLFHAAQTAAYKEAGLKNEISALRDDLFEAERVKSKSTKYDHLLNTINTAEGANRR